MSVSDKSQHRPSSWLRGCAQVVAALRETNYCLTKRVNYGSKIRRLYNCKLLKYQGLTSLHSMLFWLQGQENKQLTSYQQLRLEPGQNAKGETNRPANQHHAELTGTSLRVREKKPTLWVTPILVSRDPPGREWAAHVARI